VAPVLGVKVLKRPVVLKTALCFFLIAENLFPSSSYFPGPPPEFCKSENPEKEEKEGVLMMTLFWQDTDLVTFCLFVFVFMLFWVLLPCPFVFYLPGWCGL
jgi:hypothetical protein